MDDLQSKLFIGPLCQMQTTNQYAWRCFRRHQQNFETESIILFEILINWLSQGENKRWIVKNFQFLHGKVP